MDAALISALATRAVHTIVTLLAPSAKELAPVAARDLYAFLKKRFAATPSASSALDDLAGKPGDADRQAAVRVQLAKEMEKDSAFVGLLEKLLESQGDKPRSQVEIHQHAGDDAVQIGQAGTVTIQRKL